MASSAAKRKPISGPNTFDDRGPAPSHGHSASPHKTAKLKLGASPHHGLSAGESAVLQRWLADLDLGVAAIHPDGVVCYCNERFCSTLAIAPPPKVIGSNLRDHLDPSSWGSFVSAVAFTKYQAVEAEMEVAQFDGQMHRVHASLMRVGGQSIRIALAEVSSDRKNGSAGSNHEGSAQNLSARILESQDQERRRIARELHDSTGQELAAMLMSLSQVSSELAKLPDCQSLHQSVNDALALARNVENQIRTLSYVLHPPLLDELGLGAALTWYIEGFQRRTGIAVGLMVGKHIPRFGIEKETALFRIVQESLSNVLRHSGSKRAQIRFFSQPGLAEIQIRDFGSGMPPEKAQHARGGKGFGVGIPGMQERLQQMGGNMKIRSDRRGTTVIARLPVTACFEENRASAPDTANPTSYANPAKRILVVDDHALTRRGIIAALHTDMELEVVGEAEDGLQAVVRSAELRPDLVILDLAMPRLHGFSAVNSIRAAAPNCRILVYTTHNHPQLVSTLRAARVHGYLVKGSPSDEFLHAVRTVLAGGEFFPE